MKNHNLLVLQSPFPSACMLSVSSAMPPHGSAMASQMLPVTRGPQAPHPAKEGLIEHPLPWPEPSGGPWVPRARPTLLGQR